MRTIPGSTPDQFLLVNRIIFFAILMSVALYGVIAYLFSSGLISQINPAPLLPTPTLRYVLGGAGLSLLVAARVLRGILFSPVRIARGIRRQGEDFQARPELSEDERTNLALTRAKPMLTMGFVVPLAVTESAGILGLATCLVTRDPVVAYALIAACFLAMFLYLPRRSTLDEILAAAREAMRTMGR